MKLNICHLYPDVLNLYGDRGNITCMLKRLQWRGIDAEVTDISIGDPLTDSDYDVFFIGGGQDFEQGLLLKDAVDEKGAYFRSAVDDEKVFLLICGGYQMMGTYYKTWDGNQLDFIGAIDFYTQGQDKRMIGNYCFDTGDGGIVVGFENHSGATYLGEGVSPLGKIIKGNGNNGADGTEGIRYKNVFGSYSHGPILPKNPAFCDLILETALKRKYPEAVLEPLDDFIEIRAHDYMQNRLMSLS